jgi:hypothetical protein
MVYVYNHLRNSDYILYRMMCLHRALGIHFSFGSYLAHTLKRTRKFIQFAKPVYLKNENVELIIIINYIVTPLCANFKVYR